MRQGKPQNVNNVCKQLRLGLWATCLAYTSISGNVKSASPRTPRLKASSPLPALPYKNSPVTPQFFIQANNPKRTGVFGSFLAVDRPRAECPRISADFENVKWRGKIESFPAAFFGTEVGHA